VAQSSAGQGLLEDLPDRLEAELQKVLSSGEAVLLKIKGAFKEGLVCTDRRVIILKGGFMTGQVFGCNVYQEPYSNIAGVQVTFHLMSGYFELNAGGMQNTRKSYWSSDRRSDPSQAPNCISLNNKKQAEKFRDACTFILAKVDESRRGAAVTSGPATVSIPEQISQLASLRDQGILSPEEFEAKKKDLLNRM
jgi:Short C-terminal domain